MRRSLKPRAAAAAPSPPAWNVTLEAEPAEPSLRRTMLAGAAAVAIGFGGFLGWALTADLDSAAIASGTVIVDSHRKTVSHLEGGIMRELLVREGDLVEAGQVLLRLDATQADAAVGQLRAQYWTALARVARLQAEQAERREIVYPPELVEAARTDPVAANAAEAERRLMAARWDGYDSRIEIQHRRIGQLRDQIEGLKAQSAATVDRQRYTEDELQTVKTLLAKGYERKPRLLELQRDAAELRGRIGELKASQAEAEQAIAAAELEIVNAGNERRTEIARDHQMAQGEVVDIAERLRGTTDILRRHEVTAPQSGRVTELRYFTAGGVIPAGAPILDVVPQDDELVIEARVQPTDIDAVQVGQSAWVKLTAYKQRDVPPVEGEVISVSADRLQDERQGYPYFAARIRLKPEQAGALSGVELYPGMPAEAMIRGQARKAIEYFISPLTDSMRRAFREQ